MTQEKICPIMSRPSQGNSVKLYSHEPLFTDEDDMRKHGWTPIDGKPYSDIISCQKEKCMAWETTSACCGAEDKEFDECMDCELETKPNCKHYVVEDGFCKLIEGGNHA